MNRKYIEKKTSRQIVKLLNYALAKTWNRKKSEFFLFSFKQTSTIITEKNCTNFSNAYCDWIFRLRKKWMNRIFQSHQRDIPSVTTTVYSFFSLIRRLFRMICVWESQLKIHCELFHIHKLWLNCVVWSFSVLHFERAKRQISQQAWKERACYVGFPKHTTTIA